MLAEPVGAGQVQAAKIRALQQGRAGFHVAVGQSQRNIELVVVLPIRQRIDGDIGAVARGL